METVKPLERKIVDIHKDLPHTPQGFRTWLIENVWWIVAVGVGLSILSVLSTIQALSLVNSQYLAVAGDYGDINGMVARSQTYLWISVIATIVEIVLLGLAISPLKAKLEKGWRLLFVVSLISIVVGLIAIAFNATLIATVIGVALGAAISWYLLFEIREGFVHTL